MRVTVKSRSALTDNTGACMKKTDYTRVKEKQDDGSYIVSNGSARKFRMYKNDRQKYKKRRKPLTKKQFLRKKAVELKNHPTEAEIIFERKLQEIGYNYRTQKVFIYKGISGIADFWIPSLRVYIEVDGGYHLEEDQKQNDRVKDFVYRKMNTGILRLTNNQAMYLSIEQIKTLIESKKVVKKHREQRNKAKSDKIRAWKKRKKGKMDA